MNTSIKNEDRNKIIIIAIIKNVAFISRILESKKDFERNFNLLFRECSSGIFMSFHSTMEEVRVVYQSSSVKMDRHLEI